jgi:hypothetical protein
MLGHRTQFLGARRLCHLVDRLQPWDGRAGAPPHRRLRRRHIKRFAAPLTHAGAAGATLSSPVRCQVMRARRVNQSSMIDRVAYDVEEATLCIWFRGTGKYFYFDVPADLYEALGRAESTGAFFNERIKGHFRCIRDPARRRFGPNA